MTYDMGGGIWGQVPSYNTPFDNMKRSLQDQWSGFSPDKLCIGLANYEFYYKDVSPGQRLEVSLKAGWQEYASHPLIDHVSEELSHRFFLICLAIHPILTWMRRLHCFMEWLAMWMKTSVV